MKRNYTVTLTTMQARILLAFVATVAIDCIDHYNKIFDFAVKNTFAFKRDKAFASAHYTTILAFLLSALSLKAYEANAIGLVEFLAWYAKAKKYNAKVLKDKGAFGDLYEVLIRISLLPHYSLVRKGHLHVKAYNDFDIESKYYGKIEVGCNGKTFQYGIPTDYMNGDYDSVIYGVFDNTDKEEIFDLLIGLKLAKALEYVQTYSVLWDNKRQFEEDINTISRGKGLTVKSGKVMVQYNPSKHKAFLNALEDGRFESLFDRLYNDKHQA